MRDQLSEDCQDTKGRWAFRCAAAAIAMSVLISSSVAVAAANPEAPTDEGDAADVVTALDAAGSLVDGTEELDLAVDSGSAVSLNAGLVELSISERSIDELTVEGAGGFTLDIGLPPAGGDAELSLEDGMAVVTSGGEESSTIVQATAVGPRVMTVIDSPTAPTSYDFEQHLPPGAYAELLADGSIEVRDVEGDLLAQIAAPWAVDATGASVPVRYELLGSTVRMHVQHLQGHAYPVVADPWWWLVALVVVKVGGKKLTIKLAREAFEHIVARHGPRSTQWGSKFGPQFSRDWLQRSIETTAKHGVRRDNPGGGHQFYRQFNGDIGRNGERVLKVVTDRDGNVITAYPVRNMP